MANRRPRLPGWFVGECLGTFLLVFFGCGSVATATLTGAQVGIFQVAIVWGIAIAAAIYLTASISGAHLNPAVTVAFAVWSDFGWAQVPRYILAQCAGAGVASLALYAVFHGTLVEYESIHHIVRGAPGSEASAMIFGEFYPNPGGHSLTPAALLTVGWPTAFFIEALGTGILMLVILGLVDERNTSRARALTPIMIGLTVTILISLLGPLTMAAFNPARDLVPRIFSAVAGWGSVPFRVNGSGWLVVYVVAPFAGAIAGGGIYHWGLKSHYADASGIPSEQTLL